MNDLILAEVAKKTSGANPLVLLVLLVVVVVALIVWAVSRRKSSQGPQYIDSGYSVVPDDAEVESFGSYDDEPPPARPPTQPPTSGDSRMDALAKAVDLYGKGFLTDEEFNAEKQRILGDST